MANLSGTGESVISEVMEQYTANYHQTRKHNPTCAAEEIGASRDPGELECECCGGRFRAHYIYMVPIRQKLKSRELRRNHKRMCEGCRSFWIDRGWPEIYSEGWRKIQRIQRGRRAING